MTETPIEVLEAELLLADLRADLKAIRWHKTYIPLVTLAALCAEVLDRSEREALAKYLLGLGKVPQEGALSFGRVRKY
jgi:hypothetical protein